MLRYGLGTQLSLNCLPLTAGFCVRYRLRSVFSVFKLLVRLCSWYAEHCTIKSRFLFSAHSASERCYFTKKFYNTARGVTHQKDVGLPWSTRGRLIGASLSSRTGVTAPAFKLRTYNIQTARAYGDTVQREGNANEPSSLVCTTCTEVLGF
jgi:hypothetical protein